MSKLHDTLYGKSPCNKSPMKAFCLYHRILIKVCMLYYVLYTVLYLIYLSKNSLLTKMAKLMIRLYRSFFCTYTFAGNIIGSVLRFGLSILHCCYRSVEISHGQTIYVYINRILIMVLESIDR